MKQLVQFTRSTETPWPGLVELDYNKTETIIHDALVLEPFSVLDEFRRPTKAKR